MANPKYKTPRSKTRKRRSHLALVMPNIVVCKSCGAPKRQHHICQACGRYNDKQIIAKDEE
ncbi:50S ribosomal protein L32 [bacterium]|nr:50S ribosomal protein L32 [bacterium]